MKRFLILLTLLGLMLPCLAETDYLALPEIDKIRRGTRNLLNPAVENDLRVDVITEFTAGQGVVVSNLTGAGDAITASDSVSASNSITAATNVTATAGDVTAGDDVIATDDLFVGDDGTIGGGLTVTGVLNAVTISNVNGFMTVSNVQLRGSVFVGPLLDPVWTGSYTNTPTSTNVVYVYQGYITNVTTTP